jgi:malonyl-CoA/methylmalonyl-CoA synthetase
MDGRATRNAVGSGIFTTEKRSNTGPMRMSNHLYDLFAQRFPADRSKPVIETAAGRVYSYADLDRGSARFAAALAGVGVAKGDRVLVQVEKSPEALLVYLGCLRLGAIFVPLNTAYRARELAYFLADAAPKAFVCAPAACASLQPLAAAHGTAAVLTLDAAGQGTLAEHAAAGGGDLPPAAAGPQDIAAIIYTSGTTGQPKGAMLSHGNLGANGLTLVRQWGFTPADVLLHALPVFHVHGLFVALHCVLLAGARMLFLPAFDAAEVVRLLPRATVMMGVPTYYTRLLAMPAFTAGLCGAMRLFISGSAPLLAETFAAFRARTGHAVLERYGMSEAGMITSNPLDDERVAGSVGPPLPGVSLRIAGPEGDPLASGAVGGIEIRGPSVFQGYWRKPEKTREEFRADGWFRTGDVGHVDARGYVYIVSRAKDLIISGGLNIYPKEIELLIDRLPEVGESAVVGVPHADFGEGVIAVVTARPGAPSPPDGPTVIARLRGELAGFKLPKRVFVVDALPRNAMGKIEKGKLRERFADAFADGG